MRRKSLLAWIACGLLAAVAGAEDNSAGGGRTAAAGGGALPGPLVYDVIVVGAGTGGSAAAIQAARLGSRVALLERTDDIGGQMIAAGVTSIDSFGFDFRSGIWGEFLDGVRSVYQNDPSGVPRPMGTCYHSDGGTCFEPHVGRNVLRAMMRAEEPNLAFYPQSTVIAVITGPGSSGFGTTVTGLTVQQAGRLYDFQSKVVIDATETGYVLALSPADYRAGRNTRDTLDPDACIDAATSVPTMRRYPHGDVPPELRIASPPGSDYPQVEAYFRTVVSPDGGCDGSGRPCPPVSWPWHNAYRGMPDSTNPDHYTAAPPPFNWTRITRTGVNYANDVPFFVRDLFPQNEQAANCRARMRAVQLIYYAQQNREERWSVANDEGYDTPWNVAHDCPEIAADAVERLMPSFPYMRESLRLVGLHTLTAAEIFRVPYGPGYRARTHFPTSVALGDYAVDLHGCVAPEDLEASLGETFCDLPDTNPNDDCGDNTGDPCNVCRFRYFVGGLFQVPFESFVPIALDGLLAGDKNISVSRLAGGALRLQPSTMLVGQAAGAIAGLSVRHHVSSRQVPPVLVQNALVTLSPGAPSSRPPASVSIYQYGDVPRGNSHWAGVQMVSTHELFVGNGVDRYEVNLPLTRAEGAIAAAKLRGLDPLPCNVTGIYFDDVGPGTTGCSEIEALARAHLVSGCGSFRFCPTDAMPREQEAVFVVLATSDETSGYSTTPHFSDVTGGPYFPFVQIAFEKGYLVGCSSGTPPPGPFCPTAVGTRGDFADDLARTMVAKALTQVPAP